MAYDNRRLKTFKWLDKLQARYRFPLYVYSGLIYACDEYMVARVEYPEFYHLSDWEWSQITRYTDDDGYLLKIPEMKIADRQFNDNRYFEKLFIDEWHAMEGCFDVKMMKEAMKPFEYNRIDPSICTCENKVELSGHNKDVSIKVVFMGKR